MIDRREPSPLSHSSSSLHPRHEIPYSPVSPVADTDICETESPPEKAGAGVAKPPSVYDRLITDSWGLEFLAWLLATLILTCLIILLAVFDKKPLAAWHSRLTLNTIIAIGTQLAQSALLLPISEGISQLKWLWYSKRKPLEDMPYFQSGSNRPISSLILLWKRRTSLLVWLGVISMLLQILFGPFVQQAVSLPTRQINMDEGSILRTVSYNGPPGVTWLVDSTIIQATPELMDAAEVGFIQDGISPSDVAGSCSTGNCTFGLYTTLGVCSSVEDVTPTIVELPCPPDYHEKYYNAYNCPYTVPDLQQKPPVPRGSFVAGHNTLFIASSRTNEARYPDLSTLVEYYVIYQPDVETPLETPFGDGEMSFNKSMLAALKGTLSLCSYTYNSSMEFGVTTTTVVSKNTNLPWINDTAHSVLRATIDSRPTPETLSIDEASLQSIAGWAQSGIFVGNASMGGVADSYKATRYTFTTTAAVGIAGHLYGSVQGNKAPDGLKALGNLMDNFATSLSNL